MQAAELGRYRERLINLRSRLRDDIDRRVETVPEKMRATGEITDVPTHAADEDVEGLQTEFAAGRTQSEILAAVESALERIDKCDYGKCEDCGRGIPPARLEALPYTPYCIECERKREQ